MHLGTAAGLALAISFCAGCGSASAGGVGLTTRPVPLDPRDPGRTRLERLEYRGGVELQARDERFGGWSGLVLSQDGRSLLAVNDEGGWLRADVSFGRGGEVRKLRHVRLGAVQGLDGRPLQGKGEGDAEALARLPDGSYVVGFERRHRLWRYPLPALGLAQPAQAYAAPEELQQAPPNGGVEALATLPDGRLIVISEELKDGPARVAWLGDERGWQRLLYEPAPDFSPSDATLLPWGDLLVLERAWSEALGPRVRLVRVPAAELVPGARLRGELLGVLQAPLPTENFECVEARPGAPGEALIVLLSDDNFDHAKQRTLLLTFALRR